MRTAHEDSCSHSHQSTGSATVQIQVQKNSNDDINIEHQGVHVTRSKCVHFAPEIVKRK